MADFKLLISSYDLVEVWCELCELMFTDINDLKYVVPSQNMAAYFKFFSDPIFNKSL